jgi:hypothetical protein
MCFIATWVVVLPKKHDVRKGQCILRGRTKNDQLVQGLGKLIERKLNLEHLCSK